MEKSLLEITKGCRTCGKPFTDIAGRVGRPRLYCSNMCRGQWYWKQKMGYSMFEVADVHGWTCYLCSEDVDVNGTGDQRPHIDHVISIYFGGSNHIDNLRVVHQVCNNRKGLRIACPHCGETFTQPEKA